MLTTPSIKRRTFAGFLALGAGLAGSQTSAAPALSGTTALEVDPVDFGARGDARRESAGWTGSDDTPAINRAIAWLAERGGGDLIIRRPHFIGSMTGHLPFTRSADGQSRGIDYAIGLPSGIRVRFGPQGAFIAQSHSLAAGVARACVAVLTGDEAPLKMQGGNIRGFDIGIASVSRALVLSHISQMTFSGCAIGFLGRTLEQCCFRDIFFDGCGAGIVIGGFFAEQIADIRGPGLYNLKEAGGYADKCTFYNIRSVSGWKLDDRASEIDSWFDEKIYKSGLAHGLVSAGKSSDSDPPIAFRGVVGHAVLMMARYGRPNNSNYFDLLSHAMAARAAIRIYSPRANAACSVYTERVGFLNPASGTFPIGVEGIDPYLGAGVMLPALVSGLASVDVLNAEFSIAKIPTDAKIVKVLELSSSRFGNG
jgi:hypothetical protein